MQPCRGCWAARRLLAEPTPAPSPPDTQQAHLERVLCATTIVLFVAGVTYIALNALYVCFRAARGINTPSGHAGPTAQTRENTKRALERIPVRVAVLQPHSPDAEVVADETDQDADECAVCLAEYADGDEARFLPACGHGFHRECVDRWLLTRAPTCPVCRTPLAAPARGGRRRQQR